MPQKTLCLKTGGMSDTHTFWDSINPTIII